MEAAGVGVGPTVGALVARGGLVAFAVMLLYGATTVPFMPPKNVGLAVAVALAGAVDVLLADVTAVNSTPPRDPGVSSAAELSLA